jgi:protein ImuB
MCAHDLAVQLAIKLESEGMGAQAFHLLLYRVDHKVMTLSVKSARPCREAEHITRLFAYRSERLQGEYDTGFGIDMIRLAASSVSELDASQLGVFDQNNGAEDLDRLYDRVSSRLGPLAVLRQVFVNTHIPERAVRLAPAIVKASADALAGSNPKQPRPLRLLPMPELITVTAQVPDGPPSSMIWRRVGYKFVKASGPERLAAEWWRTGKRLQLVPPPDPKTLPPGEKLPYIPDLPVFKADPVTRDYYIAEDDGGRRFWLYREGFYGGMPAPGWHLHGLFS